MLFKNIFLPLRLFSFFSPFISPLFHSFSFYFFNMYF